MKIKENTLRVLVLNIGVNGLYWIIGVGNIIQNDRVRLDIIKKLLFIYYCYYISLWCF